MPVSPVKEEANEAWKYASMVWKTGRMRGHVCKGEERESGSTRE